ncbi:MAG: tRNA (guanosine(37)-N1)-methyltransferase TrmD [Actinomycetes bacterium]
MTFDGAGKSARQIDVYSIFPDYVHSALQNSLIGKAWQSGLIAIESHDLRGFATDPHRTVDDTPYGGGAGMVMMPTIWGEAIDSATKLSSAPIHDLIIPTPAGALFTQKMAEDLSAAEHIIFACGRYEGIDARVSEYYQGQPNFRVHEISIGDYVINGGEAAALVMIEAIVRLIPGVIGNPDSLLEESHTMSEDEELLLEYPSYTKPALWRGLEVPEILLSGHHGKIARWRLDRSRERTRKVRG